MGCSVFCAAFEQFISFFEWKLRCSVGCRSTTHYLDDDLFCGATNTGQSKFTSESFQSLARELGVLLAEEKTEGPTTSLSFSGIELDTRQQVSRLPEDKLDTFRE